MDGQHTPTPWAFSDTDYLNAEGVRARFCEIVDQTKTFAHYRLFEVQNTSVDKVVALLGCGPASYENARRIVACVNACDGIPTEWLEENGEGCIEDMHLTLTSGKKMLEQQRDQLIAVVQSILADDLITLLPAEYVAKVREAISKSVIFNDPLTPKNPWTKVSDGSPDDEKVVLGAFTDNEVWPVYKLAGKWHFITGDECTFDVIAWMDYPEFKSEVTA